jgi:hypothetical protein
MHALTLAVAVLSAAPYVSTKDGFSVEFPGYPKVQSLSGPGKKGGEVVTLVYGLEVGGGALAVLVQTDPAFASYTAADVEREFGEFREAARRSGQVTSERPVTAGKVKGLEIATRTSGMEMIQRAFVTNGRLYAVQVQAEKGKTPKDLGVERFFASFKILDVKPEAAPAPSPGAPATVKDLIVDPPKAGEKPRGIRVLWASEVRTPTSGAGIEVKAACVLVDGKRQTVSQRAPVETKTPGRSVPLILTLPVLSAAPKTCDVELAWIAGGKSERLDLECWPGPDQALHAGACKD